MTAKQYQAAIDKLGLSQAEAGRLLGVSPRTSRRYPAGDAEIPEPVAKLLRLMLARTITVDQVRRA